ncbi:hypothetical protein BB559_005134 [Furculomyces boomerangus]|uniref:Uncharacterized protein n=2 Tax=Harpellales TaxID=61421 RepID=A0A2T9YAJ4_9FUNG|nr:hypothetical protein BB559_005134 [Furculomyces boomerangus]PVZ97945.1 hypothetical protein BB558_006079 [Smittium angustum]
MPLLGRFFSEDGFVGKIMGGVKRSWFRFTLYLIFAILMWVAVVKGHKRLLGFSAFLLTITSVSYLVSAIRQEEPLTLSITGGTGADGNY